MLEAVGERQQPGRGGALGTRSARASVEVGAYAAIFLTGLVVRLAALGAWPLQASEARTALAVWRAIQAGGSPASLSYVPLLYDADLLLFWLSGASDVAARLLPALVGSGLVLAPYFGRRVLGRWGALAAALLLALSPTWVYASRLGEGTILGATASVVIMLSVAEYARSDTPRALRTAIIALAIGLTAGPGLYTLLLFALGLYLVVGARWPQDDRLVAGRRLLNAVATRANLTLFAGVFVFFASGYLLNPGGIGASVEGLGDWLRYLMPNQGGVPWTRLPQMLVFYEVFTLGLAIVGAVRGFRRRQPIDMIAVCWVLFAFLLSVPLGHREARWLPDILLPLVILAARGSEALWLDLRANLEWRDLAASFVGIVLLWYALVQLAGYVQNGQTRFLTNSMLGVGMLFIAWVGYWIWRRRAAAARVGVMLLLLVAAGWTLKSSVAVCYGPARDSREMMVGRSTSQSMLDLVSWVSAYSNREVGDPYLMDITYEQALDPQLGWYLREFPKARSVTLVGPLDSATMLVTVEREQWPPGYVGHHYRLEESWPDQSLTFRQRLKWLLFRDPVGSETAGSVQVWVRTPDGGSEQ